MEDEEIQEGPVAMETIGIEDQDPGVSSSMDRRTMIQGSVAAAAGILLTMAGFSARAQEAADPDGGKENGEEMKSQQGEKERQAAYEKVRKEGLARIERKEDYTIKFENRFGHDILAIRFKGDKSAIFIHYFAGDKLLQKRRAPVEDYEICIDSYKKRGYKVSELD